MLDGLLGSGYKTFKIAAYQEDFGVGVLPIIIDYGTPGAGSLWKVRYFSYFDNSYPSGINQDYDVSLLITPQPLTTYSIDQLGSLLTKARVWNDHRPDAAAVVFRPGGQAEFSPELIVNENEYIGLLSPLFGLAIPEGATFFTNLQVEELTKEYYAKIENHATTQTKEGK